MKTDCQQTRELLPWLINGSLEASEHAAVREHLGACEACRGQLGENLQVWQLATDHIPSLALAEFARGLTPGELDNESIERHLAICASCSEELERAASDQILDFEAARAQRTAPPGLDVQRQVAHWRQAALAAGVAAVLSSAGLIWSLSAGFPMPSDELAVATVAAGRSHPVPAATDRPEDGGIDTGAVLFSNGFEGSTIVWSASHDGDAEKPTTERRQSI